MTNTKKIIIAVLVVAVLGGLYFWFMSRGSGGENSVSTGGFSVRNFFPFGNENENPPNEGDTNNSNNGNNSINSSNDVGAGGVGGSGFTNSTGSHLNKLRKLSEGPVAGAILINDKSTTTTIRFVEKATGNVYEALSNTSSIRRLTNETIPAISRAIWLKNGSGFLAQKAGEDDIVETSFVKLTQNTSTSTSGTPYTTIISDLPTGILEITVSPDSKKIFYLVRDSGSKGFVSNPDGTGKTEVFSNFLSEWIPEWSSTNTILIKSKASAGEKSYGFVLNPTTKSFKETYSNMYGGSALGREDNKSLLLSSGGDYPNLFIRNNTDLSLTSIDIKTISEKCSWNPADLKFVYCAVPKSIKGSWPDSWYKGEIETSDSIQKVNVFDLYTYVVADLETESNEKIDVQNIQVSKDGKYTLFENKADKTLWLLTN